jgi:hypothetical protein
MPGRACRRAGDSSAFGRLNICLIKREKVMHKMCGQFLGLGHLDWSALCIRDNLGIRGMVRVLILPATQPDT